MAGFLLYNEPWKINIGPTVKTNAKWSWEGMDIPRPSLLARPTRNSGPFSLPVLAPTTQVIRKVGGGEGREGEALSFTSDKEKR